MTKLSIRLTPEEIEDLRREQQRTGAHSLSAHVRRSLREAQRQRDDERRIDGIEKELSRLTSAVESLVQPQP